MKVESALRHTCAKGVEKRIKFGVKMLRIDRIDTRQNYYGDIVSNEK